MAITMATKVWKTIWHSVSVVSGIFGIIWTWAPAPTWWPTVVALIVLVVSFVLGVVVKFGETAPEPPLT